MALKPHVKLNTAEQHNTPAKLKFNYGFGSDKKEEDDFEKNYRPMAEAFARNLRNFSIALKRRNAKRNPKLFIPLHIDYIQILFQSQFTISKYYEQWFNQFGLLGVHFTNFNHEILFAIVDQEKFKVFLRNIQNFIIRETEAESKEEFSSHILYIKEFKLLRTADILQFDEPGQRMNVKLVEDAQLGVEEFDILLTFLQAYLAENNIEFVFSADSKNLEVVNATMDQLTEIADNFDIVLQITSSLATVISPSELNLEQRGYGFTIANAVDELPIIGIIDTGISKETPLSPLLINNDEQYNITGSSVFTDDTNHGTAVAALAALGKRPYTLNYKGEINADAKLLSIKIMDNKTAHLSQAAILSLLRKAKANFPGLKIFVLTICFDRHKLTNEDYTSYAFELDKFAHENNCIISICTANNYQAADHNTSYDLNYFSNDHTNICTPAESMNNIIVGAAAHSLAAGNFQGIADGKEYPTLYSRKCHIDLYKLFPKNKINKQYFKPDIIDCGGDYEMAGGLIGQGNNASMEVLSSNPAESFYKQVGTSFSAPLIANIAAQIQKTYPGIAAQSIKALILNGASLNLIPIERSHPKLLNKIAGHGLSDEFKSVYSNDNSVTFIIEDEIEPEEVKIFPINFPEYLVKDDLGKTRGILLVSATLCFSFLPVLNQQLAYCPIHMGFCFFKNQTAEQILAKEEDVNSLLKGTLRWSQSGRHKSKPIPYSNTQKITFPVNVKELINESGTFKLAINCRINPQLLPGTEIPYVNKNHSFSIAITIEESLQPRKITGKLYSEMLAVNTNVNISNIDLEAEAEG